MSQEQETFIQSPYLQTRQGIEAEMSYKPQFEGREHIGSNKLCNKVALITGGDSGIGRAIAIAYAREGADVAIAYLNEDEDAEAVKRYVEQEGRQCLLLPGDLGDESFCKQVIQNVIEKFGSLDILVNNAGEQHPQQNIEDITAEQLERTFRTNIFAMFFLIKAALPYLKEGSSIINTTSVTAYQGHALLLDYSATKGAIVTFTRSLSLALVCRGIRVNAVAPGPIWTPLITSTFPDERFERFGQQVPMHRAGQPEEVAPSYVFLASTDSSYMSGQVLHVNGGEIVNG
jgi:NAD(P)-dependent dehydrogenase (short-subunit alcohol dehydrogenase family)